VYVFGLGIKFCDLFSRSERSIWEFGKCHSQGKGLKDEVKVVEW